MEQRNGRIDRKLQRSPEVQCHYFVFRQRPEDRVLEVLVKKTKIIEAELGSRAAALRSVLVHMLLVMHVRRRSLRSVPLGTLRKRGRLRKGKHGRHCQGDGENTLFHFFSALRAFCVRSFPCYAGCRKSHIASEDQLRPLIRTCRDEHFAQRYTVSRRIEITNAR